MKVRLYLNEFNFTPDYFTKMIGVIHKWIGYNGVHSCMSLYVYSHIHNNTFTFTAHDENLVRELIKGVIKHPEMFGDTKVLSHKILKINTDKEIFHTASPIFVKDSFNKHLIFKTAEKQAKQTLLKKAIYAGVELGDFELTFEDFKKTKLIKIHEISNRCFISHVKIVGDSVVKDFACKVGIGNSTGCGFGFIY